jgi:hypothetical protein
VAKIRQGDQDVLNLIGGNYLLAHIQTAAFNTFRQGRGFFITFFGGTDNNGNPLPTNSLWCPPEVPLHFAYDEYDEPIDIRPDLVDALMRAMNDPIGVIIAGSGEIIWPFTVLSTDRDDPKKPSSDARSEDR